MRRRGSLSLEAVMIFPVVTVLLGAASQVMLTSQARVHVEQAAYAAARSALVHKCPPMDVLEALKSPISASASYRCVDTPQKWEDAARWALAAAGSPNGFAQARGCPDIAAGYDLLLGSGKLAGYDDAARAAICYAYEPENVTVSVAWETTLLDQLRGKTVAPITATVTFRYPLATPFRRFIDDGKRADGTYYRNQTVSVTLL